MDPIGTIRSPWNECFGIPRQAGLVDAPATIELSRERCGSEALRGLGAFSHLWVLWLAHRSPPATGALVRPPRLGGNARVGVFASRSPVRPNPIGMSAVRITAIEEHALRVHVIGGDLLDGTPVLDLKPYVPWCDAIPDARADWAATPPPRVPVRWSEAAERALSTRADPQATRALVEATLSLDPRPAYRADAPDDRRYGVRLYDLDVRFRVDDAGPCVLELVPINEQAAVDAKVDGGRDWSDERSQSELEED